jgi:predicted choloylglycine hydrolase
MNDKGLAVSVNMIQDSASISQDTGKPGLTTTTAVRLLLDKAANVEEAMELLRQYDLHASMGMMVHFALADSAGRSVAVEYIGNEMSVIETPVVTNFYLTPGEKYGIGTSQSHTRYETLTNLLEKSPVLTPEGIRDALSSVSKGNFGEFESTEWSIVMDLANRTARYYHRENYDNSWLFALG